MISTSELRILWTPPDISAERWEFFHHPAKQDFYLRHGVSWEALEAASPRGRFAAYPRGDLLEGTVVALSWHAYDDYLKFLSRAKRGYRRSYTRMEEDLQRSGTLSLPSPIVVACGGEAILFSGYRRLCLAWNHRMVPYVWLVQPECGKGEIDPGI